jgi:cell division protein FtsB
VTGRTRRPSRSSGATGAERARRPVDLRDRQGAQARRARRADGVAEPAEPHRFGLLGRRSAVIATVVAVTVVLVALPVRSYLHQQSDVAAARAELDELERENDQLAARQERLSDPDDIARIARRDYGLVEVGEESYSVLPPTSAGLVMPQAWPFDRIEDAVRTAAGGG